MKKKIMVIGATGLVGNAVANQLNKDGYDVIVMSRDKEKAKACFAEEFEVLEADVLEPNTLGYAFQGVDGVFISLPERTAPKAMPNILERVKASGLQHLVYISGCTVRKENAWHPMIKGHYEAERAIEASGIPYTFMKLTMVMDMIPRYANNGKPFIIGKQNHGWSWIHSSDIARMASAAFTNAKSKNKSLTIWGKENSTIAEAVDLYNKTFSLTNKPAKPKPYWMANLLGLMIGEKLKYAISIFRYFEDHPEEGNPAEAYNLLGEPKMSLNSFLELEKSQMA